MADGVRVVRRRSLLIVEDEAGFRRSMASYFEGCGLRVTEAGSVGEAHRRLDAEDFDAVVLDVALPDGDGLSLLARTDARRAVVVSGNPDPIRFEVRGVILYLAKPVDLCELRSAVEVASLDRGAGEPRRLRHARARAEEP